MRVFHLPNPQSHHLLAWLLHHADGHTDRMIASAFDRAYENHADPTFNMYSDYDIVRYELSELLQAWFYGRFPWIIEADVADSRPRLALLNPLLKQAVDGIDWEAVAEGLLRQLGKWSPADEAPFPCDRPPGDDDANHRSQS